MTSALLAHESSGFAVDPIIGAAGAKAVLAGRIATAPIIVNGVPLTAHNCKCAGFGSAPDPRLLPFDRSLMVCLRAWYQMIGRAFNSLSRSAATGINTTALTALTASSLRTKVSANRFSTKTTDSKSDAKTDSKSDSKSSGGEGGAGDAGDAGDAINYDPSRKFKYGVLTFAVSVVGFLGVCWYDAEFGADVVRIRTSSVARRA